MKNAGWLRMGDRRISHTLNNVHKILKTGKPEYLRAKLQLRQDVHNVRVRHRSRLHIPSHRTSKFKSSFSYHAVSLYNTVPDDLKSLSLKTFKKIVKDRIFNDNI
jgi:hypothetical protein